MRAHTGSRCDWTVGTMRRVGARVAILILGIALAAMPMAAQEGIEDSRPTSALVESGGARHANTIQVAQAVSSTQQSGLPRESLAERTERAYRHVFIAFAVAWILIFGYVVVLGRRFTALDQEVTRHDPAHR